MPELSAWIKIVWYAGLAAQVALILRLIVSRIASSHVVFLSWVVAQAISSAILIWAYGSSPPIYYSVWLPATVVTIALDCAFVWAVFGDRTKSYGGIKRFGMGLLVLVLLTATIVSLVTLSAESERLQWTGEKAVPLMLVRTFDSALAIFLILAGVVFGFFRETPLRPNVLVLFRVALLYFVGTSLGFLAGNLTGRHGYSWANLWLESVTLACSIWWTIALNRAGEAPRPVSPADSRLRGRIAELDDQLSQILGSLKFSLRGLE